MSHTSSSYAMFSSKIMKPGRASCISISLKRKIANGCTESKKQHVSSVVLFEEGRANRGLTLLGTSLMKAVIFGSGIQREAQLNNGPQNPNDKEKTQF